MSDKSEQLKYLKANSEPKETDDKGVELNQPFLNDSDGFSVHAKNQKGDTVLVKFTGSPVTISSKDKSTPSYWNEKLSGCKFTDFKHQVFFDMTTKKIRSVRDGVQEYYGVEIGEEPADKVFTIYRSPEAITAIAGVMDSLPIINDHIDPELTPTKAQTIGSLISTDIVEFNDEATSSTLYLENNTAISDKVLKLKDEGKKEFSLGYLGKLKEHDEYDFEQYDLKPTHLALVDSARGGSVLTFVDKRIQNMGKKTLPTVFLDADGNPNLEQIVEIAQDLPEALKKLPADKLKELLPVLQEAIAAANGGEEMPSEDADKDEEVETVDMEMEYEDMEKEDKEKFSDSKLFKSIVTSQSKSFSDSKVFKDAVSNAVDAHTVVIEKATNFVDEQYVFAGKSTKTIMADAIAVEHGDTKFEDSELSTAFKLLKRTDSSLVKFGDGTEDSALEARITKDLEG